MAKRSRPTDAPVEADTHPGGGANVRKKLKRVECEIAELEAVEARRARQLEKVRAELAALRTRHAALVMAGQGVVPVETPGGAGAGPTGYCMREKRRVTIADPVAVTLSNGRAATAGTCATCGARIVALTSAAPPAG